MPDPFINNSLIAVIEIDEILFLFLYIFYPDDDFDTGTVKKE